MLKPNTIINSLCLDAMRQMPDESIDCVITSPRDCKGKFLKGYHYSEKTQFQKGKSTRTPKPHWEKDWLQQKYHDEKLSIPEIAALSNCSDSNISFWLKKHGISTRSMSEARKIKRWGLSGEKNGMYGKTKDKNKNWKGGITPERQAVYSTKEWKELVQIIFKRDNYCCKKCEVKHLRKNPLHIHHIKSFADVNSRMDAFNLILLCKRCHNWVHSKKNINKEFIID